MKITITRKGGRNLLTCQRADGTSTSADVGPGLPHHDIAHFVAERALDMRQGFFGKIASGRSIAELSEPDFIKRHGRESMPAEVVTRALQALSNGACLPQQFEDQINAEFRQYELPVMAIGPKLIDAMLSEFIMLIAQCVELRDGERLELEFPSTGL